MAAQLWRNLKPSEQSRLSNKFVQLEPVGLATLPDDQFYMFAQWIYGRQKGIAAHAIEVSSGLADFTFQVEDGKKELLRVYTTEQVPMAMLYAVLKSVEGLGYEKVSLYLRSRKSTAEARLQQEFPMDFEVVDIDGLRARLTEVQGERPRQAASKKAQPEKLRSAGPRARKPRKKPRTGQRRSWLPRIIILTLIVLGLAAALLLVFSPR